ncbi:MAG: dihydrodipicolinate synthase family protein [Candidatus Helarchaeota archaeon]|nr:dihydrodipicolinate synthase family protein [Candidatus Helarchaeota archaeon]
MNIEGIIPPVVTLYKKDGSIDETAIREHVDFLIENGVHGIFSLGSTGEFAYLSDEERKQVLKITVDQVNGKVPVIAGISSPSVRLAINWGKYAEKVGANATMAILPAYFPVTKKEVYSYFETLSNGIKLPLFLYNFPSITFEIKTSTIQKLAENNLIIGIKETVMKIDHVREVIELVNDPNFIVLVGVDPLFKPGLEIGAKGAILGSSNFAVGLHSQLYNAFKNKDQKLFDELYSKFNKIIVNVLQYASPIQNSVSLAKEAMKILGRDIETIVRSPLPSLNERTIKRLEKSLSFLRE